MSKERILVGDQEIVPGVDLQVEAFSPVSEPVSVGGRVEAIRGGGFYGKAILLPDEVIKTTQPDSWHELWRLINWGLSPFPSQSSVLAAELDVMAGKIIHQVVPSLTDGRVITPNSIGYVNLDKIGFGQALERMRGRGARFDGEKKDNEVFKQTREMLWQLGVDLGIEHAAQVHPDNPFGKPNLWTTGDGQMIWLDVLPAIKHTGWVWPGFNFKFHQDVRGKIGEGEETFNRVHTDRLRGFIKEDSGIRGADREELEMLLGVYDELLAEYVQGMGEDRRVLVVEDAVRRGLVSADKGKQLMSSDAAYYSFLMGTIVRPAVGAFMEFISSTSLYRVFADKQFQADIRRFSRDPMFRQQRIIENTILKGAREAYEHGLISDEEWQDAWDVIRNPSMSQVEARKLAATYLGLQTWFTISGNIINSVSIPLLASSVVAENPLARIGLALLVDIIIPPVVRAVSVLITSLMTKQDLRVALKVSAIPKAGGYFAFPADISKRLGNRSEKIWHLTKRGLIVSLSKILKPWGGWNSDLEATLWEKLRGEKW